MYNAADIHRQSQVRSTMNGSSYWWWLIDNEVDE